MATATDRRGKNWLEAEVQRVTDQYVTEKFVLDEGKLLTPHRISKRIAEIDPEAAPASVGAISNILKTWAEVGFAVINDKPLAFSDYTEAGREQGVAALKEATHAARREAKAAERAAAKEAAEKAAEKERKAAEREAKRLAREQAAQAS